MNRRKFLATLCGAGAALAVGPTLLALVPKPAPLPHPVLWTASETLQVGDVFTIHELYIQPAAAAMAAEIDSRLVDSYLQHFTVTAVVTSEAA